MPHIALRGTTAVLALAGAVTALAESAWLGGARTGWILLVAGVVAVAVCRTQLRFGPVLAAAAAVAGLALVATGLGWQEGTLADRLLARDVPPAGVWALAAGAVVVLAGCVALAVVTRGGPPSVAARDLGRGAVATVAAVAVAVPGLVGAGLLGHSLADRRAGSVDWAHAVSRPAERGTDAPSPDRADEEVWRTRPTDVEAFGPVAVAVVVPGWDVVLTVDQVPPRSDVAMLAAFSTRDGAELWSYGFGVNDVRHEGGVADYAGIVADPDAGRILVVDGDAFAVLALEDGSEITSGRLPDRLRCGPGELIGDQHYVNPPIMVSRLTVMQCEREVDAEFAASENRMVVLRTADGAVLADPEVPGCNYAAVATASSLFVSRWGGFEDQCRSPVLFELGSGGRLERIAAIRHPAGAVARACDCQDGLDYYYGAARLMVAGDVGGDVVVHALPWGMRGRGSGDEPVPDDTRAVHEIVAHTTDGDELWRLTSDSPWTSASDNGIAAVTDAGVVVRWADGWRLLRPSDGRELAAEARLRREAVERGFGGWTADGERVYTVHDGGVVVRRADDLAVLSTVSHPGYNAMSRPPVAGDGLVIALVRHRPHDVGDLRLDLAALGDGAGAGT